MILLPLIAAVAIAAQGPDADSFFQEWSKDVTKVKAAGIAIGMTSDRVLAVIGGPVSTNYYDSMFHFRKTLYSYPAAVSQRYHPSVKEKAEMLVTFNHDRRVIRMQVTFTCVSRESLKAIIDEMEDSYGFSDGGNDRFFQFSKHITIESNAIPYQRFLEVDDGGNETGNNFRYIVVNTFTHDSKYKQEEEYLQQQRRLLYRLMSASQTNNIPDHVPPPEKKREETIRNIL